MCRRRNRKLLRRKSAEVIEEYLKDIYNGKIEMIIAINMDNTVSGVRVLKHQETPGLGDKVELRNLQSSIYHFSLYDNLGNVMIDGEIYKRSSNINLEELNSGVYSLRVISDGKVFYSKVIKK